MAYLKHFFSFIFILSGVVSLHAQTTDQTLTSCLEEGKKFFSAREYPKASIQFEKCVAQNPSNVDAQLSLAGALLTQNKFKEAEEHFTQALQGDTNKIVRILRQTKVYPKKIFKLNF